MRSKCVLVVLAAGLLWSSAGTVVHSGEGQPAAIAVQSLVFEEGREGGVVRVQLSGPPASFSCSMPPVGGHETLIDVPGATTTLADRVDLHSPLVPEVSVERSPAGSPGVRLRLRLADCDVSGIEQSGGALLLRLARSSGSRGGEYRIGVGDKLEINVFGHEDLTKVVEVRADGTINYPLIGDLSVTGRTVGEIDAELTRVLGSDFLVDPQVSVDVREYQSQWVTIVGEVHTPGKYFLKRNMSLIDLLAEAGGATKEAGAQIVITRKNGDDGSAKQIVVDRGRLLAQKNQENNVFMRHGDLVAVGEKEVFYIRGEVTRPGPYLFESGMTVLKAISVAGGFTQFANRKQLDILRSGARGVQDKIKINLKAIEEGKKEDFSLLPDDTIIVPRRIF